MVKSVLEHSREARRLWWWCDRTGRWALEAVVSFGRTNCRSVGRPPHCAVFCESGCVSDGVEELLATPLLLCRRA